MAKQKADHFTRQLESLKQKYRSLQSDASASNPVALFGRNYEDLNAQLQRQARDFEVVPVGPVGAFVKVKPEYEKWVKAVEATMGEKWRCYLVNSHADGRKLQSLAERCGVPKLEYVIFRHMTATPVVEPKTAGVLRDVIFADKALHVESAWVMTFILDQSRLDRVALFENLSDSEAKLVVKDRGQAKFVEGVSIVYTIDGGTMTVKRGGITQIPGNNFPVKYLTMRKETQLVELTRAIAEKEVEARAAHQELEEIGRHGSGSRGRVDALKRTIRGIEGELKGAQLALRRAQEIELPSVGELSEDIMRIDSEIQEIKEDIEQSSAEVEEVTRAVAQFDTLIPPVEAEVAELQQQLSNLDPESAARRLREQTSALKGMERSLAAEMSLLTTKQERLKTELRKVTQLEESVQSRRNSIMDVTGMTGPPEDIPPLSKLEARRVLLEKNREKFKMTKEEVERRNIEYKAKFRGYRAIKEAVAQLSSNVEALCQQLKVHIANFEESKKLFAEKVLGYFTKMLRKKGHTGSLKFDHSSKTLTAKMLPNSASADRAPAFTQATQGNVELTVEGAAEEEEEVEGGGKDGVGNLSGGERSFTTLSLICAIGTVMDAPFRMYDEYDVYMDESMRKLSTDLLTEAAKQRPNVQFIFITPHDIFIEEENKSFAKVQRLKAPRREAGAPADE